MHPISWTDELRLYTEEELICLGNCEPYWWGLEAQGNLFHLDRLYLACTDQARLVDSLEVISLGQVTKEAIGLHYYFSFFGNNSLVQIEEEPHIR